MKKIFKLLFCFICPYVSGKEAVAQKDSLYLYAQPPIAGEFKSIRLGVVNFDADGIGDISIKKYKIRSLKADMALLRIETTNKNRYYGWIHPSALDGKVYLVLGNNTRQMDLDSINEMSYSQEKFKDRISGNVSLGFNYSKSTSIGKLNVDGKISYAVRDYNLSLSGTSTMSFTPDSTVRENENVRLLGGLNLSASWVSYGLLNYQRNFELGIIRRLQEGLGVGNKILIKPTLNAILLTGFVLNEEKAVEQTEKKVLAEIPLIVYFDFFRYAEKTIEFSITQSTYFSLSQKGRIRNDGQVNFSWELIKDFWLTSIFYNNFDSKPPNNSNKKFDYSIVLGIKYKF